MILILYNSSISKKLILCYFKQSLSVLLKPGIHYAIFALISPRFYSLNKLTLVEESQSQSADYS